MAREYNIPDDFILTEKSVRIPLSPIDSFEIRNYVIAQLYFSHYRLIFGLTLNDNKKGTQEIVPVKKPGSISTAWRSNSLSVYY
jgi:hypothetical protein